MYIVSACLAGFSTRYDGKDRLDPRIKSLVLEGRAIPLCPEQLGGLPTPRPPLEFESGGGGGAVIEGGSRVLTPGGEDRTGYLMKGAEAVLALARLYEIEAAVLKDGSPSCGVAYVYCGGWKTPGRGVAAEVLARNGIKVLSVDSI